jgi:signal transduction histidine kinase/HAMP domain-containing protein
MSFSAAHVWVSQSLSRKFLSGIAAGLIATSLAFLVIFMTMYRAQLHDERSKAVEDINRLLQTSLENAMLKRDLEGLQDIVNNLGQQDGITDVLIINPEGEVRFASNPEMLGKRYSITNDTACSSCHTDRATPDRTTIFTRNTADLEVLRSVNPVRNKPACTGCHGAIEKNPFNGILFVDYDATPIRQHAQRTTLLLTGSGALVVLVVLTGGWWFMRRFVLLPVNQLFEASKAMANGQLDTRVNLQAMDEMGELGRTFNMMGERLENSIRELRQKDLFLQGVVDAIPDGIRVIDDQYNIVLSNRTYRKQLGCEGSSEVSVPCYSSSHQRKEPCPATLVSCPLHEVLHSGEAVKILDQFVNRNGKPVSVEVVAAPMNLADNSHSTMVVESIRNLEKHLQFSQEQRLSELGRLAAGVAHEIYNPLTSIRLALDSMVQSDKSIEENMAGILNYMEIIDSQIDLCISITKRLLKLSMSPEERQVVDINEAVTDVISLVIWEAEQNNVIVRQHLDESNPRLIANETEFRTVILNLIQNAFHAMPDGGTLDIHSLKKNGKVVLCVNDTGVGISPEDKPHIFEPFFSRRADDIKGTGLGLPIARAVVEKYGGNITMESKQHEGSKFTVTFTDADTDWRNDSEQKHTDH